jgi:cobalt-zinc-cadmium efflux system membrane fusion protein
MEIIDNSKVHADLIVFEKDLFKVKAGQKVRFVLTNQDNREIEGKIYGINKSFEDETKGIIVHAAIKNAGKWQLIPGMYVRGLIDVGNQVVPVVPEDAVVHAEGKDFIFILDSSSNNGEKMRFRQSEVIPGIRELGFVQITPVEELKPNTRVVVRGAFYLLSAEKATGDDDE